MDGMETLETAPFQLALDDAVKAAKGKTALMRLLNERGHLVGSHNTIAQWRMNGVPSKYAPDIEFLTGVPVEKLCPDMPWRRLTGGAWPTPAGRPVLDFAKAEV